MDTSYEQLVTATQMIEAQFAVNYQNVLFLEVHMLQKFYRVLCIIVTHKKTLILQVCLESSVPTVNVKVPGIDFLQTFLG